MSGCKEVMSVLIRYGALAPRVSTEGPCCES
jgi:hypothetical protein